MKRVLVEQNLGVKFIHRWGDTNTKEESEDRKLMGQLISAMKAFASMIQPPQKMKEEVPEAEGEAEMDMDEQRTLTSKPWTGRYRPNSEG